MAHLGSQLDLERCPHCKVDQPNLRQLWNVGTTDYKGSNSRQWIVYQCGRCGGLVTAASNRGDRYVTEFYPVTVAIDDSLPSKAREYLSQALNSLHSPAGAIMLAASGVDAMLKEKKYAKGNLKTRIDKAAKDHLITKDMAKWAHQVRLEANDQRHADEEALLPNVEEAQQTLDFALALGEFLFVLPSRVTRGLEGATEIEKI